MARTEERFYRIVGLKPGEEDKHFELRVALVSLTYKNVPGWKYQYMDCFSEL